MVRARSLQDSSRKMPNFAPSREYKGFPSVMRGWEEAFVSSSDPWAV